MRLILLVFGLLICRFAANGQDPEALNILNAVSNRYKNLSFTADFDYTVKNKTAGINEKFDGSITVKDEKYRMKTPELEILNDGTDVYTYLKEANEINIAAYYPEEEEIGVHNIFDIYKEGYKYSVVETKPDRSKVIDLEPQERKTFLKIRMKVSKGSTVDEFQIFEESGNVYTYIIKNFKQKKDISNDYFAFDPEKYPGVEIIDFR